MLSGLSPHTALYARWLMVPVLCLGLLAAFWWEGRLQTLWPDLKAGRPVDKEAALAVGFCAALAAVGLVNAWRLIVFL